MSNDTIRWPGQLWASSASDLCCTWLSAFVGPETSLLSGLLPFEGCVLVTQSCPTLCNPMDYSPAGSSVHGINSPGKNTGEGCHALLQGIFSTQGSNCTQFLYRLSPQRNIKKGTEERNLTEHWVEPLASVLGYVHLALPIYLLDSFWLIWFPVELETSCSSCPLGKEE